MDDISKHIVDRRERIEVSIPKEFLDNVQRMNALVSEMLQKVMHAYKASDVKKALDVMFLDLKINKIYSDLMNSTAQSKNSLSNNLNALMQFTIFIKNIESLGDYIKKLVRIGYYIVTGAKLGK